MDEEEEEDETVRFVTPPGLCVTAPLPDISLGAPVMVPARRAEVCNAVDAAHKHKHDCGDELRTNSPDTRRSAETVVVATVRVVLHSATTPHVPLTRRSEAAKVARSMMISSDKSKKVTRR